MHSCNSQLEEPSTGAPRSDTAHQLLLLIEFFIALSSEILVLFGFVCRMLPSNTSALLSKSPLRFDLQLCFRSYGSVLLRLTELAAFQPWKSGQLPNRVSQRAQQITFAIKLNEFILPAHTYIVPR